MRRFLPRVIAIAATAISASAAAQLPTERLTGQIEGLQGTELRIKNASGQAIGVRLADNVAITVRAPAKLEAIKPGAFIGTTAVPQVDGTLSATEIHVFPESMRGVGEGHRPMDRLPGSTMTNATVASVTPPRRSTMTNATVATVSESSNARRITLTYKGGEKTVLVGDSVIVTTMESGDRSTLAPGAPVAITATKEADGTLVAARITVGRNGYEPD